MSVIENSLAPPTRFDLRFRVGDIPVRVHPFFWLTTVFLALTTRGEGMSQIWLGNALLWVAILFVSILVHELGHVLMGRWFGTRGHIVLTGFCGLAIGSNDLPARWQRIAVSLAGPGAGFLFAAAFGGACALYYPEVTLDALCVLFGFEAAIPPGYFYCIIRTMLWVNIFWGLVNLLPIWPLDGGQISREIWQHFRGREGMRLSLVLSLATAAGLAALALVEFLVKKPLIPYLSFGGTLFPVAFFGLLAYQSWQLLQHIRLAGPDWDQEERQQPRAPWEQDADWWKRGGRPYD